MPTQPPAAKYEVLANHYPQGSRPNCQALNVFSGCGIGRQKRDFQPGTRKLSRNEPNSKFPQGLKPAGFGRVEGSAKALRHPKACDFLTADERDHR
jgi:hypothetical protein